MARISKSELVKLEQDWMDQADDIVRLVNGLLSKRESVLRFEIVRHDLTKVGEGRVEGAQA